MNKTAIKNFAINARKKLIADIVYKAGLLGVNEEKILSPLPQSTSDLQFFDVGTKEYTRISGDEIKQRNALVSAINAKAREIKYKDAFEYVVEEVAYTWFNRLIALRFMEVNDYLPSRIRVLSSENPAKAEPDFVTNPYDTDLEFTSAEQEKIMQLKDQNKLDDLFRMLFIKQCNKLHEILPGLFEQTSDYTELLLTISFTDKDGVIWHLIHDIEEKDFNVETLDENGNPTGQIEIIGWMYQYYNVEPKDKVFANLKKNIKISKENIPAATQLFTPDWIVRYMVENSLGRLWVEGHPNDDLKSEWKYYLEEAEQEVEVQRQLSAIHKEYADLTPEDITCIDPCMGSGHILVYMFDVLMQIYESYGYTQRDAARLIVEKNLYGLDIDRRAYQLSYFAVMMKARQYNRRILNGELTPNVFAIQDSSELSTELINFIANCDKNLKADLQTIKEELKDATEYGSILDVTRVNFVRIYARMEEIESAFYGDIFGQMNQRICRESILPILRQAETMSMKYWTICTNPPYMGAAGMGTKLSNFVRENYTDSKSDLSTVCMERASSMCMTNGFWAMINIPVWMFISSYTKLRNRLLKDQTIINMVHPGRGIFGSDFGTTAFVFRNKYTSGFVANYRRLFDEQGEVKSIDAREQAFITKKGCYVAKQDNFYAVPGTPVAYWISNTTISNFQNSKIGDAYRVSEGIKTGDNERFLRLWYEVNSKDFSFAKSDVGYKWFPHHKGGDYRRWYGNLWYCVNWENDGSEIKQNPKSGLQGKDMYFKPNLGWSKISAKDNPVRYYSGNVLFDSMAPSICGSDDLFYLLGLLNSKVAYHYLHILNPTLALQVGDMRNMPVIIQNEKLCKELVLDCISISKNDWDSFETSWDFKGHPLVQLRKELRDSTTTGIVIQDYYGDMKAVSCPLEACYLLWQEKCKRRFYQLKNNEEKLNEVFIGTYRLHNELVPEVDEKDVTIRNADLQRDIRSLISYAIGCMFGRYSLDAEGLVFAGGEWDETKYQSFIPDVDNCIPITDEEYFKDDIVGLLCVWLKKVYGEEHLETNLDFIASALGNKGNTSREVIRNYFMNDFMKDHLKFYQKRPIYWLFDSGKQNGFKALVYMHRWNADTVGNVRVEYLHKVQHIYEREITRMQEIVDSRSDSKEINRASKRQSKLVKQLQETKDYDARLAHIALSRIDIDLDDGVKVNYEKVQTGKDGKKQQILAKI